jgi:hypothetical protein
MNSTEVMVCQHRRPPTRRGLADASPVSQGLAAFPSCGRVSPDDSLFSRIHDLDFSDIEACAYRDVAVANYFLGMQVPSMAYRESTGERVDEPIVQYAALKASRNRKRVTGRGRKQQCWIFG